MNSAYFGVLLCRGVGLLLFILGASAILPAFVFGVHSGWTTYAPMPPPGFAEQFVLFLHYYLPGVVQALAGIALLFLGRPVGRLLTRGLSDHAV